MEVKVLGPGCKKCKVTANQVLRAIKSLNRDDIKLTKVETMEDIMKYNILSTPAVVIDEKIKVSGRIPSSKEIIEWILEMSSSYES